MGLQRVRTGQPTPITATGRRAAGRRIKAARLIAGMTAHQTSDRSGVAFRHLVAIENGREPLVGDDYRRLEATLGCPAEWLRRGWA
jgi:transcriptional regulator with XRE-family HTH domain